MATDLLDPGEDTAIGHIDLAERADVVRALGDVVRRVLLGLVLWRGGRFRFEPQDDPPVVTLLPELDVERTLLDALRLADELRATA